MTAIHQREKGNTKMGLIASLAVTTDRGGESSPYSAPVLLDTNALNRLVPLAAPEKLNVTIKP